MERVKAFLASLYWMAISVTAFPALALAQGTATGSSPSTGGAAAPAGSTGVPSGSTGGTTGGTGWLWIVAALIVLAIIWWAMSTRRRHGTVTR